MPAFLEYDPLTGVEQWVDMTDDNRLQVHYRQDVEPIKDYAARLRNDGLTDRGIKNDLWLYAVIPPVVILELRNRGIDVFNRNHQKRVFEEINQNYPHLKTTEKTHSIR